MRSLYPRPGRQTQADVCSYRRVVWKEELCPQQGTVAVTQSHSTHLAAVMCGKSSKQDDVIVNSAPVDEEVYGDKSVSNFALFEFISGDSGSTTYILAALICFMVILYIVRKKIRPILGKIFAQSPPAPPPAPPVPSFQLTPRMFRRLASAPAILNDNQSPGAPIHSG